MRLYLMTLMTVLACCAMAQGNRVYIEDFEIVPGDSITMPVVLVNQDTTYGFQFGMMLPRGLEVKDIRLTDNFDKLGFSMSHGMRNDNCMIMVYSLKMLFCPPDSVEVLEIDFSARPGFKGGDISLWKGRGASSDNQCIFLDDGTVHVTVPKRSLVGVPIDQQQGGTHFNTEEW